MRAAKVSFLLFLGSILTLWYLNESLVRFGRYLMDVRATQIEQRIAAGIFLGMLILWWVVDIAWGKNR